MKRELSKFERKPNQNQQWQANRALVNETVLVQDFKDFQGMGVDSEAEGINRHIQLCEKTPRHGKLTTP